MGPFEIDIGSIHDALMYGIELEHKGNWIDNQSPVSLTYHPQIRRFVLVFGTSEQNAGFVLLEDIDKTWRIKRYVEE